MSTLYHFYIAIQALQASAISDKHLELAPFPLHSQRQASCLVLWKSWAIKSSSGTARLFFLSLYMYQIHSIHKGPHVNKLNMQLRWINKPPGLNKTDDLGRNSHQRHYRLIIQAHYFTSVLNASHSDNFMKLARFKSIKYAWASHHSS